MTTITSNYSWQMPDPGGSANTWGDTLNATTQAIDAQVHTNQTAIGNVVSGSTPLTGLTVTGNISCQSLVATGDIDTASNVNCANMNATQHVTCTWFSAQGGPVSCGSLTTNGGAIAAGDISCHVLVSTSDIDGGANINASGSLNANGNVTGSHLISTGDISANGNMNCVGLSLDHINASGGISSHSVNATGNIIALGDMGCDNLNASGDVACHIVRTTSDVDVGGNVNVTGDINCPHVNCTGLVHGNTISSNGDITVGGNLNSNNAVNSQGNMTCNGQAYKPGGGSWQAISDARIKTVMGDYEPGLYEAVQLRPVVYTFKGNDGPAHKEAAAAGKSFVGLIADEVLSVIPDMVEVKRGVIDGQEVDDYKTLDLSQLVFMLINSVKELKAEIDTLRRVA